MAQERSEAHCEQMSKNPTPKEDFRRFVFLVWNHLNLPEPTPTQYEIASFLQHGPDRLVIQAFRGVGKSWITAAFVVWKLWNDPTLDILVVSASKDKAAQFTTFCLSLIRTVPVLKPLIPRDDQRQSTLNFDVNGAPSKQQPSMVARGITSAITGSRADIIVADDIENPNNSDTQTKRDNLAERVKEFSAILKPGGSIAYLGTPQSEQSVYNLLPERGFLFRIWPARVPSDEVRKAYKLLVPSEITEDGAVSSNDSYDALAPRIQTMTPVGSPTDPARFPERELVKRELDYGRTGFALQFMLDTSLSDREKYPLKLRDLVYDTLPMDTGPDRVVWTSDPHYQWRDLPNVGLRGDIMCRPKPQTDPPPQYRAWEGVVMAIDPSGARGKDETAYAVGSGIGPLVFLRDAGGFGGGSSGYDEKVLNNLARIAKKYSVEIIKIEENFGQGMFAKLLQPVLIEHKVEATIEEIRSSKQKELRICDTLEPLMNRHQLIVDRNLVQRDYDSTLTRAAEEQNHYRLFWQMARMCRERGALPQDDRIDVVAMLVAHFIDQMAEAQETAAQRRRDEDDLEELAKFMQDVVGGPEPQTRRIFGNHGLGV